MATRRKSARKTNSSTQTVNSAPIAGSTSWFDSAVQVYLTLVMGVVFVGATAFVASYAITAACDVKQRLADDALYTTLSSRVIRKAQSAELHYNGSDRIVEIK